ncbi:16S rRNA (cytosine(1402)-N(4))-methyltransferase RsmH [Candidatus Azambacteria bacterium]|nr:16S rRNA (cytosine(1402)-N(4))-methyltransferase RsmH [Candidatus Azambacteria bacterium]
MSDAIHTPVLLKEIVEIFDPQPGQIFVDATANGGGHTFALWEKVKPSGTVIAIDKDHDLIAGLKKKARDAGANVVSVQGSYAELPQILHAHGIEKVHGILLDLGYSSYHIDQAGRGFSFQKDEPLDMRYDNNPRTQRAEQSSYDGKSVNGITAEEVVNGSPEGDLADVIYRFGEERFSRRIARAIVEERKRERIRTSGRLAEIVRASLPSRFGRGRIHPATKTFQALRIFVNHELQDLEAVLPDAVEALMPQGKLAVISFHSLEDRIVKNFFRTQKQEGKLELFSKKPIQTSREEEKGNPRARSAKLRVAIKL